MAASSAMSAEPARCTCPRCGATDTQELVAQAGYHCRRCAFELAHLEISAGGTVRRVIGWLRAPGEVVGDRYRVSTVLGKGGYAATYLVEDVRLQGKRRALKEIPEDCYDEQETRLLSRLHHEGIPDITDQFTSNGMVYLVLEFGGTKTLESERRRAGGRVSLDGLSSWMLQVCDVLAYLHEQQPPIVHRDLKPANILLDEHDRVMLVDFGIAKASFGAGSTRTVARAVTHGFSPPEQILGPGTDTRSDIYALGATMYVLSTGTVPPPAHQRVTGSTLVPPRALRAEIPPHLERLILWCVELRPEARPQSIEQVRTALSGQPCGAARVERETLTEAVTVPVLPPTGPMAEPESSPAAPPTRPTHPSWGRSATTATALLGLGTAVALLQPWRAALWRHERGSPVPNVDRPTTTVTLAPERVATPAPSPAEVAASLPTPSTTLPEPLESRIRRALGSDEFAEVTIQVTGDRIVLGRLQSDGQAQRARQLLASLGLENPIDTDVAPQPKPSTDSGAHGAPRPARSPPAHTSRHTAERPRQQAARQSRPARRQPVERASPPADWVLVPQPARRTD